MTKEEFIEIEELTEEAYLNVPKDLREDWINSRWNNLYQKYRAKGMDNYIKRRTKH